MKTYAKRKLAALVLVLAAAGTIAAEASMLYESENKAPGRLPGTASGHGEDDPYDGAILTEKTIEIPGVTREYTFLFITDAHAAVTDGSETADVSVYAADRIKVFRRDGKIAAARFAAWMDYAAGQELDGVLLAGDIIDFPSQANINYLGGRLAGLSCPYLYAPGNHDWTYPWEYMTDRGRKEYLSLLAPFMQGSPDFHMLDCGEFLIAAADNSSGQFTEVAARGLEEACGRGKPVILLVHVPLLTQSVLIQARNTWESSVVLGGGNYGGIYPGDTSQRVIDLVAAPDSPVKAVLAGHVHFADTGTIEGSDGVRQIVGDAGYKDAAVLLHVRGTE